MGPGQTAAAAEWSGSWPISGHEAGQAAAEGGEAAAGLQSQPAVANASIPEATPTPIGRDMALGSPLRGRTPAPLRPGRAGSRP